MALTLSQETIIDELWDDGAIKVDISPEGGFRIKAQDDDPTIPNSPFYVNIRSETHPTNPGPVRLVTMHRIGDEYFDAISGNEVGWSWDWFVDIPHAGVPFGDQIERLVLEELTTDAGRLQLEKEELGGGKRRITNKVVILYGNAEGNRTLLTDDLITKAGTKLEAIKALEAAGYTVVMVLVFIDRGSGAEELRALGYNVVAVVSMYDVVDYLRDSEKISVVEHKVIRDYLSA